MSPSELPTEYFARARAVAYMQDYGDVDLTPRPIERRPTYTLGPGFWIVLGACFWLASVIFGGWTIAGWRCG